MNRDAGTSSPQSPWFTNSMLGGLWGNAGTWDQNATYLRYQFDQPPRVGDIAQWRDGECSNCSTGHVAYVESVNADGTVTVSEYNYNVDHGFDVRTTQAPRYIHVVFGPTTTGIVDSAGFGSKLSPGTLFSIFGQNLSLTTGGATTLPLAPTLNGTTILFNGIPTPVLWTSPTQVNAQVPYETSTGIANLLISVANAATTASATVNVTSTSPGVFTSNQNGVALGAIEHADGSIVNAASPAQPGEIISIYLTGLGVTAPSVATGQAGEGQSTVATPTVSIGGQSAQILFAGLSNFPGLYQINAVVPNLPAGYSALLVSSGGNTSQSGVMVPIAGTSTSPTLSATLNISPQSGQAPLTVTLIGAVGGTATGTTNFTFYCDSSDDSTSIISGSVAKFSGVAQTQESATCSYATPGAYAPKVIIERGTGAAEARQTVTVSKTATALSLTSLSPSSFSTSTAPFQPSISASGSNFSNVNQITFNWSGSINGSATWLKGDSNWNAKVSFLSDTSMSLSPILTSAGDPSGTSTWTITLTDVTGATASQSFIVTYAPPSSVTLTASLTAAPTSGQAPLAVTLTAAPGGTATGTINYTFYCDSSDNGTSIIPGYVAKFDGVAQTQQSATCSYTSKGTYTPKVVIQRGTGAAEARQIVTVSQALPPPTIFSVQPSSTSAGSSPQTIVIVGNNFQTGIALALVAPVGSSQTFTGNQLQNFSSATFQVSAILNVPGNWVAKVTNPDGQSASATISVTTQATLTFNFSNWPPFFTIGDKPATIGLQINNPSGGFISGTVTASTSNGGAWLSVDGHTSDTWSIVPSTGSLTTSISLTADPSGLAAGIYSGSVIVSSPNASNATTSIPVTMTILTPLQITTTTLPVATWGQPYSATLQATGGSGYTWSLQSGSSLPSNLSLSSSGVISGTLISGNSSSSWPFTALVTDSRTRTQSANLVLQIQAPIVVTSTAPSSFQFVVGQAYVAPPSGYNSLTFQATGGTSSYSWAASGLPPGLRMDAPSGTIVGTPTQPGTFSATITATDSAGRMGSAVFNLVVIANPPVITSANLQPPATLPSGTVGAAYSGYLDVIGGTGGYQWTVSGFPLGISGSVNPTPACASCSYQIAGTPTQSGSYTLAVRVTDLFNNAATASVLLLINAGTPPTITTTTLPLATIGQPYSSTFAATGGVPPYQWSFSGASPDAELQLTPSGLLQGTSSVANDCATGPAIWLGNQPPFGTFSSAFFQVRVTDSAGQAASKQLCLPAYYPTPQIAGISPSSVTADEQSHTLMITGSNFRSISEIYNAGTGNPNFINSGELTLTLGQLTPACLALNNSSYVYAVAPTGACWAKGTYTLWIVQPYSQISNQATFTLR